ncbi:MAG TPA: T9SS type A sorting domain-containing protein [Candidatus Cloacimonetes bacterium]|nr:T9SS type A sorting domain-containing protein [Candidatus Cloacimonadota bacterium]
MKASRWDYQDMVIPGIETVLGEETLLSIPLVPDYVANDDQIQAPLAADFGLQNYPNPFNPSTTIAFIAPESGDVRLSIFNIKGQKVRDLHSGSMAKGHHTVTWDGLDDKGIAVSSGVFFVRIEMNGKSQAHKMVLMK